MLGFGNLGTGRDARFNFFQRHSLLHGGLFVLRGTPVDAVALAVAQLVAQGFVIRDDQLDAQLREIDSPWVAQAVEIGDSDGSSREGIVDYLADDTVFEVFLKRRISRTLVMVTARELPDATTELVIYPHASDKGDPQGSAGAEARLRRSYKTLEAAIATDGTLVSHKRFVGIANDGSPASQEMARKLVGWH